MLDGGSLYWVIKGFILVRQRILDLRPDHQGGRHRLLRHRARPGARRDAGASPARLSRLALSACGRRAGRSPRGRGRRGRDAASHARATCASFASSIFRRGGDVVDQARRAEIGGAHHPRRPFDRAEERRQRLGIADCHIVDAKAFALELEAAGARSPRRSLRRWPRRLPLRSGPDGGSAPSSARRRRDSHCATRARARPPRARSARRRFRTGMLRSRTSCLMTRSCW